MAPILTIVSVEGKNPDRSPPGDVAPARAEPPFVSRDVAPPTYPVAVVAVFFAPANVCRTGLEIVVPMALTGLVTTFDTAFTGLEIVFETVFVIETKSPMCLFDKKEIYLWMIF